MSRLILSALVLMIVSCTGSHENIPGGKSAPPPVDKPEPVQMSHQSYLRKLSLHVRGMTPSRADYDELDRAEKSGTANAFFREKIAAYLASDEHIDKMTSRLEELFFLRSSSLPSNAPPPSDPNWGLFEGVDDYTIHNSINQLFRDVATRNLNWDTLLTGKRYTAFPLRDSTSSDLSDPVYFSAAAGTPKVLTQPTPVSFEDDDNRVAGALTTSRFFNRYGNTALNKNRRRAAAVFRIFLCDNMPAVVVDEAGNQDPILDKVFPSEKGGGKAPGSGTDRHGTEEACMKCHAKLDPLGLTFQASGLVLSPFASPGALVYPRPDGSQVNIPAHGLGELADTITKQNEYARCQVKHFWDWFVGVDVPVDETTMRELTLKFDEVGRRGNEFIAYILERPEFGGMSAATPEQELANQVKGVFQRCNSCHTQSKTKEPIPSFTDWPIGGDAKTHAHWVDEIQKSLGLIGSKRSMPPPTSGWQPSATEIDLLRRWFSAGAPAEVTHETY